MNRSITAALSALREDTHCDSGWVHDVPAGPEIRRDEAFIAGFGWIRADASWVSRSDEIIRAAFRPEWIDRWRLRRAVRAWAKRRVCHLEGHNPARYQRKGTRRSNGWSYVAEDVTQTRSQCTRCGHGLTDWEDVPGTRRGFTSYSAPKAIHDRVMYGGGDWDEPRRAEAQS